jgi:beta-lactamase class A
MVEQRTENPRVDGSIPPLGTKPPQRGERRTVFPLSIFLPQRRAEVPMMPWRALQRFLLPPLLLGAGVVLGILADRSFLHPRAPRDFPIREGSGFFTNPLLDFEVLNLDKLGYLRPFQSEIEALASRLERDGKIEKVAIYYRDLNNGPWLGVKEEKEFVPGSLFKVPLVVACLRQAERDPSFLRASVRATPPGGIDLSAYHYPPPDRLQSGRTYTVQELIERVCRFSDNLAAYLLMRTVDRDLMKKVFFDLGIDPDKMEERNIAFSCKQYGRFFRILYNASYLSREMSEYALANFSQSAFRDGLAAGVPAGIPVAHKFGENVEERGGERLYTLHDAGIVYHRLRPYLLCVMTRGTDFAAQARAIAACSNLVWNQVNRQAWTGPAD